MKLWLLPFNFLHRVYVRGTSFLTSALLKILFILEVSLILYTKPSLLTTKLNKADTLEFLKESSEAKVSIQSEFAILVVESEGSSEDNSCGQHGRKRDRVSGSEKSGTLYQ